MVNTPRIMKNLKRALPVAMAVVLGSTAAPLVVKADSSKVVTLGANLSDSQKLNEHIYTWLLSGTFIVNGHVFLRRHH